MDDSISRKAAIDAIVGEKEDIKVIPFGSEYCEGYMDGLDKAVWVVREFLPSAQPEIIRCRDCKFYTSMISGSGIGICDLACRHLGDNGFCSEAERREE